MKLQVLGAQGMLGRAVVKAATRRGHEVYDARIDVESIGAGHIHAGAVINCAGLVKQRQVSAARLMAVNAVGPHRIAEACDVTGARLIHVSTDCVFSCQGPHTEIDQIGPEMDDIYARSKYAGEVYDVPHLTVRTSFVGFGERGLLARLVAGETIHASNFLLWSGHTVDTIADVLITLAERADITGLLHIPGEYQSRADLCDRLIARYELSATVERGSTYWADRRLASIRWYRLNLPSLPPFAAQLETMERP
jgi:dTDP-4-dehydrorhamnose reductase